MVYATAGLAFARLNYASTFNNSYNELESVSLAATKAGWLVGAGVDYAIDPHWAARVEFTHTRFGAVTGVGSTVLTNGSTALVNHSSGAIGDNSVRLGVNYRFGD